MFDAFEISRFLGRPVQLFVFTRQHLVWRYCAASRNFTFGELTYHAAQIKRSEIRQTGERAKDKLKITMAYLRDPGAPLYPNTQPLGANWYPYLPSDPVYVHCLAAHWGDEDPPAVEWSGRVLQPRFTDQELELTCEQTGAIGRVVNQGPSWGRPCWKTVHSTGIRGCNLPLDAFRVDAEIDAVSGLTLTAPEFASSPLGLAGGWFEWERSDGLIESRGIIAHDGSDITLLYGAADLQVGLVGVARPNCPGTWAACTARGNTINYGGAIYKPVKNPNDESMSWG